RRFSLPSPLRVDESVQVEVVDNRTAAMFILCGDHDFTLYSLALSGYITGLTNTADLDMIARLRTLLPSTLAWRPEEAGVRIDPPAYYTILVAHRSDLLKEDPSKLIEIFFPIIEHLP